MTTEPLTEAELAELRQDVAVLDRRFPVNRDIARLLATLDAERERMKGLVEAAREVVAWQPTTPSESADSLALFVSRLRDALAEWEAHDDH